MKKISLVILNLLIALSITSCSGNKTKRPPGKYVDLMQEVNYAQVDKTLSTPIKIPTAQNSTQWLSSSFDLTQTPENIKIDQLSYQSAKYKLITSRNLHTSIMTPVISNNRLFAFDNNGYITAYELGNFRKALWSKKIVEKGIEADLAAGGITANNTLIAATFGNNILYLINQESGEELWQYKLSNLARSAPVIKNNHVFVLTIDNRLYCFDLQKGEIKWTHEGAVEQFGMFGFASPVATDKLVIAPHSSGQLHAINISNGEVLWSISLIKDFNNSTMLYLNDLDMTPIVKNGVVYISNYAGTMFAIALSTGELLWSNDSAGGNKFAWVAGEFIYTVNRYNQMIAIYAKTGQIKWEISLEKYLPKKEKMTFSGPTMINNQLHLLTSKGKLLVIDPIDATITAEYQVAKSAFSPLIAVDNAAYLIDNSGNLSVIN